MNHNTDDGNHRTDKRAVEASRSCQADNQPDTDQQHPSLRRESDRLLLTAFGPRPSATTLRHALDQLREEGFDLSDCADDDETYDLLDQAIKRAQRPEARQASDTPHDANQDS